MDEGQRGLLAKVLEDRTAEEPRLVYADFLKERDDPRGEFITVQIELARRISPGRRHEFARREAELLAAHQTAWSVPAHSIGAEVVFSRGFVSRATADANRFVSEYAALLDVEPVRSVTLTDTTPDVVAELVETDIPARISNLTLRGRVGDEGAELLAGCRHVATLKNLNLNDTGVTAAGARALAGSEFLAALETLTLTGNEIYSDGLSALASARKLSPKTLYVARCEIDDEGVVALAKSTAMANLQRLGLGGNDELTDAAVNALLKSKHLQNLKKVEWPEYADFGDGVMKKIEARWGAGR